MDFIIFWLISILTSYGIDFSKYLQLFKTLANDGVRLDFDKMKKISNQSDSSEYQEKLEKAKMERVLYFIPGVNIALAIANIILFSNILFTIIDEFYYRGYLQQMDDDELKKYQKHPNILTALIINCKSNNKTSNSLEENERMMIEFELNGEISQFIFTYDDKEEKIKILEVIGPMSKLSDEEKTKLFNDALKLMVEEAINKYGKDDMVKKIVNQETIDCSVNYDLITNQFTTTNENTEENKKVKKRIKKR